MTRYAPQALIAFAEALYTAAGLDADKSAVAAPILVEADLMGHDTHGLQQLVPYLNELEKGGMRASGEPEIVADHGAVAVWNGNWLNGIWLTANALDTAAERARKFGLGAVSIQRSHHIACLQAYLPRMTEQGLMAIVSCSDPSASSVAPFGGRDAVFAPDPIAAGIPTGGDPILIDMSSSITTNGMVNRKAVAGEKLKGKWMQDADGVASDDPGLLKADPPGALLLTGGQDHGQKGYGMAVIVEALTQGLSGYGRANREKRWGGSVFVQVFDPALFAGLGSYEEQTANLVRLCHASRPIGDLAAVRLPGENALRRKRDALANGVTLFPGTIEKLAPYAERFSVALPKAL
ncbi:MAG TPA: Ldh family oxidoreductase [Devosiaceae bacterium]|jgi:LDH2 family malate/lactate/ureidoglycolate dehydrogenase